MSELTGLRADVTDDASVRLAVGGAVAALGGSLDILVTTPGRSGHRDPDLPLRHR
jgi:NAD(P)-dependent dehydrogenase (short-subunit alcohol dehydrogenase family)